MLCVNPFVSAGNKIYGCGQCNPCRFNRRRVWAHRIMLEASQYEDNTFVTLTYSDEKLPAGGSLVPEDLRNFVKRLRRYVEPDRLRYFSVGEYGDTSWRPHYHLCVFNFRGCDCGKSRYDWRGLICCKRCLDVGRIWGYGNVYLGKLEEATASYIAGYTVKKLTHASNVMLKGRYPEFARMSTGKPGGIGVSALDDVASDVLACKWVVPDVSQVNYGKKAKPLGRYLTKQLRLRLGRGEKAPQEVLDEVYKEVLPLQLAARASKDGSTVKKEYLKFNKSKLRSFEVRSKIFDRGKKL